ncbi:MAG: hypothetical protein HY537_13910 [Deltaproteobacteria bacterium]|nr:hypothetical protein [Deltaproteobacteria bacterium]
MRYRVLTLIVLMCCGFLFASTSTSPKKDHLASSPKISSKSGKVESSQPTKGEPADVCGPRVSEDKKK